MQSFESTEKVEKRDFSAVGNGILWLTPCKLACERSLETGPYVISKKNGNIAPPADFFSAFDTSRPLQMIDIQYGITIIGGRDVSRPYHFLFDIFWYLRCCWLLGLFGVAF